MARYFTTTLPYVNADPHIGHALEIVQTDVLARAARAQGQEVFFSSGTDEHGQKILKAAQNAKQEVQEYVDHYAAQFDKLFAALGISSHAFIRTTDPAHIGAAQEMWRRCKSAGDIYKKSYTGLYCVGCEAYKTEKELINGECSDHAGTPLEKITEENYFFRLSKYEKPLAEYLKKEKSVVPARRRQEAINFVESGLEDVSVSRSVERLSWGVPVPDDNTQVMYVWFDALTNYISTLGWPLDEDGNFKKFWIEGETLQMAGKDQIRFQSIMWQAMLMSVGIKNTDQIFYHGFINSGGCKMSKSIGNVISPYELVEKYGTAATRYILLRHAHPTEDTDITWQRMDEWYTANLVNGLGNLVARVMKLAEKYLSAGSLENIYLDKEINAALVRFESQSAMDVIWAHIKKLDQTITETEPFKVVKEDTEKGRQLISEATVELHNIGVLLEPFMPDTSKIILEAVRTNKKPENLFPRLV